MLRAIAIVRLDISESSGFVVLWLEDLLNRDQTTFTFSAETNVLTRNVALFLNQNIPCIQFQKLWHMVDMFLFRNFNCILVAEYVPKMLQLVESNPTIRGPNRRRAVHSSTKNIFQSPIKSSIVLIRLDYFWPGSSSSRLLYLVLARSLGNHGNVVVRSNQPLCSRMPGLCWLYITFAI